MDIEVILVLLICDVGTLTGCFLFVLRLVLVIWAGLFPTV